MLITQELCADAVLRLDSLKRRKSAIDLCGNVASLVALFPFVRSKRVIRAASDIKETLS